MRDVPPFVTPSFVGIDLGTSNSALASFDGQIVGVVPNAVGETLTPSVVRIDAAGAVTVGRRAQRQRETDPGNVAAAWKRLMGSEERLRFEAAGRALLPEELSAHLLSALLADARDVLGWTPRAAVISTPALFELPQNHATTRAGTLAGLEEVALIQEPIAGAIAAGWRAPGDGGGGGDGSWLVIDPRGRNAGRVAARDQGGAAAGGRPRGRQLSGREGRRRRAVRVGGGGARPPP